MKTKLLFLLLFTFISACSTDGEHNSVNASGLASGCGQMNEQACEAFNLINSERIAQGIAPLAASNACVAAAQAHAEDMNYNGYFSHDGLNETWGERMDRFNIFGMVAENIAQAGDAEKSSYQWMNSTGHRNNILNPTFLYSGMGYISGHWVQCFTDTP